MEMADWTCPRAGTGCSAEPRGPAARVWRRPPGTKPARGRAPAKATPRDNSSEMPFYCHTDDFHLDTS